MLDSSLSASPNSAWSRWGRIAYACFMFAVATLQIWKEFFRFEWVFLLCMGLWGLLYIPMQKGESSRTYLRKPRTLISSALAIAAGVVALHMLYDLFTK